MNELSWLQDWYARQCDGEWEHGFGVEINTLDNPGWRISISLKESQRTGKMFQRVHLERSETDWIQCWVEEGKFEAAGGVKILEEALPIFRNYVTAV